MTAVLGVSADYHDAAAALVVEGELVAAAEEERFTRVKHDPSLPRHAMAWCLDHAGVRSGELASVVFYDKPLTTYERILVTHAKVGPRGFPSLSRAVATWSKSKLWVRPRIERVLEELGHPAPPIRFAEHHVSHAASAFYPSPFESAAVLTFDGVGEWATSSIGHGSGNRLHLCEELRFPDSLGLFYSAMTAFCGFEVNDGEYKLMGLAPYGEPRFAEVLREKVIRIADDGSVRLDQRWFEYRAGSTMTSRRMAGILDGPPLVRGEPGQREADIARSTQVVLEDAVLAMAHHARDLTGEVNACLAGGVALNCVANERLLAEGPFENIWVQPAAGDSGGAVGAALWGWHAVEDRPRAVQRGRDGMSGAFLGPEYSADEVRAWLECAGIEHQRLEARDLFEAVAADLADGATVGWFHGRAEFGPRALGHRSILADPRDPGVIRRLNLQIKGREGFRPFAPAVMEEHAGDWFELEQPSPYMLFTTQLLPSRSHGTQNATMSFSDRLGQRRSDLPACTHVDGSARVQTVSEQADPWFHGILKEFNALTGCPVLVNTSFNRAGEPVVLTPADAYRCFVASGLDLLVLEDCVVRAEVGAR